METTFVIIILVVIIALFIFSKSKFEKTYEKTYDNQTNPPGCNFKYEDRPFPSGRVPGSYLGLSKQEQQNLLIQFLEYNGTIPSEYETV